jgi:hypothetical protein
LHFESRIMQPVAQSLYSQRHIQQAFLHYLFRYQYHSTSDTYSFLYHRSYIILATNSVFNITETLACDLQLQIPSGLKPGFQKHLWNVPDFNLQKLSLYCKQGSPAQQNNVCSYAAQYNVTAQHVHLRTATFSCNTMLARNAAQPNTATTKLMAAQSDTIDTKIVQLLMGMKHCWMILNSQEIL